MSTPDQERIDAAHQRLAASRREAEAKPMKPWDVQRLALRDSFRLDDLVDAHNKFAKSVRGFVDTRYRRTELDARDLMRCVDIMGLYVRWQRERIDRLERLLVASGALAESDLPTIGGFTGAQAEHDLVMLMEANDADIDAVFDLVEQWSEAMGDV
jgi:hypothetical protein